MWVATRRVDTPCGTVAAGRLVADGDPMLDGAPEGAFVRVVEEGPAVVINVKGDLPLEALVEEATAEPGKVRRTSRRGQ